MAGLCYLDIVNQNMGALCFTADGIMCRENYRNKGAGGGSQSQ